MNSHRDKGAITPLCIRRIQSGKRQPRIDIAHAIAKALGVTIEECFGLKSLEARRR